MVSVSEELVFELQMRTMATRQRCEKALVTTSGDICASETVILDGPSSGGFHRSLSVNRRGAVAACISGSFGALVELSCETNFGAKYAGFKVLADDSAKVVAEKGPEDLHALLSMRVDGKTFHEQRRSLSDALGERIAVRRFKRFETSGKLAYYLHNNQLVVMVDFEGDDQTGRDLAMHIAAKKPIALTLDKLPIGMIDSMRQKQAVIPEPLLAPGCADERGSSMRSVCSLSQAFVRNRDQTIEEMLQASGAAVNSFEFFVVGGTSGS